MGFLEKYHQYIDIEWKAQFLQRIVEIEGPSIEILTKIDSSPKKGFNVEPENYHYLVIQGSFDPPTIPHITLLIKSIELLSKQHVGDSIQLVILFSLAHVDKTPNVLQHSLLGERAEILEYLLENHDLKVPIVIGLSNMARYIDLIEAMKKKFDNQKSLTFITGMDVFKKVFDSKYYSDPLNKVLPEIFQAKFFVAGRNDIFSKDDFIEFTNSHLKDFPDHITQISFIAMPEKLRYLNATQIRESFNKNRIPDKTDIPTPILKFLKKNNIYSPDLDKQAIKVAIQSVVRFTIEAEDVSSVAVLVLEKLSEELQKNRSFNQQIINEYQSDLEEKNKEIYKRWKKLRKSIS